MIPKFIRKLFDRETDKVRLAKAREHMRRACAENIEASSQVIRKTQSVPRLVRFHGPESI